MSVLFITSSFGGYALMHIFSLFNKNQFMILFSRQLIVLMGLLCAVLLFLYAYFTSKLTNEIALLPIARPVYNEHNSRMLLEVQVPVT